jgi:hypothetical protein
MQREMKKENKKTTKTGKTTKSSKQASEKKITFFGVLRDTVMVLINLAVVLLLLLSAKLPILSPEQLTIAAYPNYLLLFFAVVNILLRCVILLVVSLIGHAVNMALNVLGSFVHTSRLQYLEFFGKFFEDGGEGFVPVADSDRYTDQ